MNGSLSSWASDPGVSFAAARGEPRLLSLRDGVYYLRLRFPGNEDYLEIALHGVRSDVDAGKVLALFESA